MEDKRALPFLSLVARDLLDRFGSNLADVTVVFPSRRARLFFNNYLYEHAGKPVWTPRYLSIDELFEQAASLRKADATLLVCELYKAYTDVYNAHSSVPSDETLDEFFFFGEILLNDFDDIDKNRVNTRSLFSNLQDLDLLRDDFSHLNESQIEALMHYFKHAFHGETSLKTAFWSIWNLLGEVYLTFRERLEKKQMAYPGMLMRSVIENETTVFPSGQCVFAGFNILNKCEEALFKKLNNQSLFYWDYDSYYLNDEAGRFIATNIKKFGSALEPEFFDQFQNTRKKITFIASSSESGQSAVISPWTDSLNHSRSFTEPDSAVVLCNERILPTVMHAVPPEKVENVNITMGFPITQTPICSFLQVITEMQTKGYVASSKAFRHKYVLPVLRHPYTRRLFPEAGNVEKMILQNNVFFPSSDVLTDNSLFSYASDTRSLVRYLLDLTQRIGQSFEQETPDDMYSGLYQESVFRAYQVINRLYGLITSGELDVEKSTFFRLIKKLFTTTQIPFHGEPVKGLQIMGVLETRLLDFKNLLVLSTNEGFMPGSSNDNSFIPQFLRRHFELSTVEHQDSVYAYYFYRLIQRAENITFVYNTDKTQTGKAEMSRFLLQLLIDSRLTIDRFSLQPSIRPIQVTPIEIPKTESLLQKIRNQYDHTAGVQAHTLSPSAINTFIDCSFRFYLQYIEGLRNKEELTDELDSSVFGTIFHRAAELLYREIGQIGEQKDFSPFIVQKEHFDAYLQYPHRIEKLVSRAFDKEYFKGKSYSTQQYNGEQLINFRVICHMLRRLMEFDQKQTPFYIHGLELPVYTTFQLENPEATIRVGGIIDRLEEKNGTIRIIDYKTSGSAKPFKTMEDLIIQKEQRPSHIFQTFTYASVLINKKQYSQPVIPGLLYLQDAGKENYSAIIPYEKESISDFNELNPLFEELFKSKVSELFDPDIPFQQTTIVSKCSYCDFKELCNRQ